MSSEDLEVFDNLFASPTCVYKQPQSYYDLVQSPTTVTPPQITDLVATPVTAFPEKKTPLGLIASPIWGRSASGHYKTPSKKRSRPGKREKPRKKALVTKDDDSIQISHFDNEFDGFAWNDGGFPSPAQEDNINDVIDWSITGDEIENLKAKVVPMYWEKLRNAVHAVVRITVRLYVVQDWNRFGYLMVTKL